MGRLAAVAVGRITRSSIAQAGGMDVGLVSFRGVGGQPVRRRCNEQRDGDSENEAQQFRDDRQFSAIPSMVLGQPPTHGDVPDRMCIVAGAGAEPFSRPQLRIDSADFMLRPDGGCDSTLSTGRWRHSVAIFAGR